MVENGMQFYKSQKYGSVLRLQFTINTFQSFVGPPKTLHSEVDYPK